MAVNIDVSAICPDKQVIIQRGIISPSHNVFVIIEPAEDKYINVEEVMKNNFAVCNKVEENKYYITLNMTNIQSLWEKSWLYDYVPVDIFEAAFILHELSHVRYTNFDNEISKSSQFKAKIRNILEDSRIEYCMSYDFPETSIFFNILLSSMQTCFKANKTVLWSEEEANEIQKLTQDLYDFTRYNIINKDANKKFISDVIPLVLLARRGSSTDCDIASEIISNLVKLEVTDDSSESDIPGSIVNTFVEAMTESKRQEKCKGNDDIMQEIANKFFDKESVKEQIEASFESGIQAGSAIEIENKERTSFFLKVANEHHKEIEALRNIFNRAFTEFKSIHAKDGDLNFMRQQEAYMNSITGEDGNDYQYRKKEKVLVDVVLLRDISGSIGSSRENYAKAIIILLSALENLDGIRTAQIDFNGTHFTNKTFDSGIEKATINPVATGGTSIKSAYEEVLRYQFKGKRNIVIVISDGGFMESRDVIDELENNINRVAKLLKFAIGGYNAPGYKSIRIEDIPKEMAQAIIKEGLQ